mgnify:FL=1
MGIFDFLKSNSKKDLDSTNSKPRTSEKREIRKKVNSIYEMLNIDIKSSPDESFIIGNSQINESGNKIVNYRKNLNPKELGIFDTLEIKVFEGLSNKNFIFSCRNFNKSEINKVREIVDSLFLFYGLDSDNKGKFANNELEEFNYDYWSGRYWTTDEIKNPVMFGYDDLSGLTLTLFETE